MYNNNNNNHCNCNVLGRGVFSTADIDGGAFLCQYYGELITANEGEQREESIPSCFRFFFRHSQRSFW